VRLDIQHNRIVTASIFGDFMGQGEMSELTARLHDVPYTRDAVMVALADVDVAHYIANVTAEELLSVLVP
jgi:lipoate-protein ligase A